MLRLGRMHLLLLLAALATSSELPRRAMLGIELGPASQGGTAVKRVLANTTASTLGITADDVVLELNGVATPDPAALLAAVQKLAGGASLQVKLRRAGRVMTIKGTSLPRPSESWPSADVAYEHVVVGANTLRSVMVRPEGATRPPVVFMVQGYTCGSIEWMNEGHPYRQLFEPIVEAGYAVYRVEKLGVGDSRGSARCADVDWQAEQDAFAAAYRNLFKRTDVDTDKVFIFGHSMGGVVAPLLAANVRRPKGVAVFGTVLRPWDQYLIDIVRVQPTLVSWENPVQGAERAVEHYEELRDYLLRGADPDKMIKASASSAQRWQAAWQYSGGPRLLGRAHGFWRGLARQRLTKAWHSIKAPVLVMFGESDLAALDDEDHKMIARIANHASPGSGTYVSLPGTNHGFALVGDEDAHRKLRASGGLKKAQSRLNPAVRQALLAWLNKHAGRTAS